MQSLLADGIEVNGKTDRGQTALMLASVFGNKEIVQLLLSAGADTTLKDDLGLTARDWSLRRGFTQIAEVIAEASPSEPTRIDVASASQQNGPASTKVILSERNEPLVSSQDSSSPLESTAQLQEQAYEEEGKHIAVDDTKRELGGAAGAILRSRSAQASHAQNFLEEDMPQDFSDRVQEGNPQEAASPPAEHPGEHSVVPSNQPIAAFEEEPMFELSGDKFQEQLPVAQSRPPTFADDPASQWSIAFEPDPLTLPAELIDGADTYDSDDTKPELLSLPTEDEENEPETTRISARPRTSFPEQSLPLEEETMRREIKVPSFHTLQPQRSMRPMLWLLIVGVMGGSALLAYRFNSYFFANDNSVAVVSQSQNVNGPTSSNQSNPQPTASEAVSKGPSASPAQGTGPVTGGPLAGTERDLPKPDYPASARSRNVVGTVTMLVRVNRLGRVISWRTLDGDPLLRAAALKAAKSATFDPNKLPGSGEVVGTIRYNFPP